MQCTKTTYPHSKYNYVTCSKSFEGFIDTSTNLNVPSTGVNQMQPMVAAVSAELQGGNQMQMSSMQPMVKPVSPELQAGVNQMQMSSMQPMVKPVSAVTSELQGVNQMQNPTVSNCDICDKTSLYYTIGVLVILLIILIGYTIYQSGKNSN